MEFEDGYEYAFESPFPEMLFVTTNPMLAKVMHNVRPKDPVYRRPSTGAWEEMQK